MVIVHAIGDYEALEMLKSRNFFFAVKIRMSWKDGKM